MVSASRIITSTKLTVIISLSYLNCDSRMSVVIIASDMSAAAAGRRNSASQKKFNRLQASRKVALLSRSASVATMMTSAAACSMPVIMRAARSRRDNAG